MCKYCKELNKEKETINICEIEIDGSSYFYSCPINYCPNCGKKLKSKIPVDWRLVGIEKKLQNPMKC
jgi:hypothetical protein